MLKVLSWNGDFQISNEKKKITSTSPPWLNDSLIFANRCWQREEIVIHIWCLLLFDSSLMTSNRVWTDIESKKSRFFPALFLDHCKIVLTQKWPSNSVSEKVVQTNNVSVACIQCILVKILYKAINLIFWDNCILNLMYLYLWRTALGFCFSLKLRKSSLFQDLSFIFWIPTFFQFSRLFEPCSIAKSRICSQLRVKTCF